MLSPGVAPCVIHVNALPVPLSAGTCLTARYDWDFGDPGKPYNRLTGWVAAHWYDQPGDYTITLTVTDETAAVRTYSAHLNVAGTARGRTYVALDGNDGRRGLSADDAVRTVGRAAKLLRDDQVVLFKAGGTYDVPTAFTIKARDVAFGRYGDGPDPVLNRLPGNGSSIFTIDHTSDGVVFRHLTFDSPHAVPDDGKADKVSVDAIHAAGRNLAVRDCTFLNVDDGINANGNPVGMMMQDCNAPLATGLRAYLVWGQGSDFVCLGNHAANSTREHIVRMSGLNRALIAYNDFTNLDRQAVDHSDFSKGTIECHAGTYYYVARNVVHDGTIRLGPLGVGTDRATDWCVIDGNTFLNTYLPVYSGTHHAMLRNNIIDMDRHVLIDVGGADDKDRVSSDLSIVNNTGVSNGDYGQFLKVSGHVDGITLRDNLFVAPNLKPFFHTTAVVNVAEDDLASFTVVDHNLWPLLGGTDQTEMLLGSAHKGAYCTAAQWMQFAQVKHDTFAAAHVDPATDALTGELPPAARQGVPTPGVWEDRDQHPRPRSDVTLGALEATTQPAPSLSTPSLSTGPAAK